MFIFSLHNPYSNECYWQKPHGEALDHVLDKITRLESVIRRLAGMNFSFRVISPYVEIKSTILISRRKMNTYSVIGNSRCKNYVTLITYNV